MNEEWNTEVCIQQEATHDGKYNPAIDDYLLMKIVNHAAADEDVEEMKNPKRIMVRVLIQTKEVVVK